MALRQEEITCKSALNRVQVSYLPFRWSLNPYRSCSHGCAYCYSRSYHEWLDMDPDEEFNTHILVKTNLPEVLRRELARPSWNRDLVAIGTAVDPYQPVEGKHKVTRRCLEILLEAGTPVTITTKNTMIWRDVDLLQQFARGPGVSVNFSITTLDPELVKKIEPDTSPPEKRLAVMERLVRAGVPAGVFLAPILPGLTDQRECLETIVRRAAERHATHLHANVLRLEGAAREVYWNLLRRHFPRVLPLYEKLYHRRIVPPLAYRRPLEAMVKAWVVRYGVGTSELARRAREGRPRAVSKASHPPVRQLQLFPQ